MVERKKQMSLADNYEEMTTQEKLRDLASLNRPSLTSFVSQQMVALANGLEQQKPPAPEGMMPEPLHSPSLEAYVEKKLLEGQKPIPLSRRMTFDQYQTRAADTAIYPDHMEVMYPALGLAGECGELCEKIKRLYRGDYSLDDETRHSIMLEIGDVLWYLAAVASDLGLELEDAAAHNLERLAARFKSGTIRGDGDNR